MFCDRVNRPTNKEDDSTRLSMTTSPVKFLFSVVELLVALRNIKEHYDTTVPDIGGFVRSNYPFLLSHVWHVRLPTAIVDSLVCASTAGSD